MALIIIIVMFIALVSVRNLHCQDDLPPDESEGGNEVIVGWTYLARIQGNNITLHAGYDDYKSEQRIKLLIYDDNLSLINIANVQYNQTYVFRNITFLYTGHELKVFNATIVDLIPYQRRLSTYIDLMDHLEIYTSMDQYITMRVQVVQDFPDYHKVQIKVITDVSSQVFLVNYETWYRIYTHTWIKLSKTNESRFYAIFHSYYKLKLVELSPQVSVKLRADKQTVKVNEPLNVSVEVKVKYKNGTEVSPSGIVVLKVINASSGQLVKTYKVLIENGVGSIIILFKKEGIYQLVATYSGVSNTIEIKVFGVATTSSSIDMRVVIGGIILFVVIAIIYYKKSQEGIIVGA